jgi:hypothetical protein
VAGEHKLEEAAKAAAALRDQARAQGKDEDWARALLQGDAAARRAPRLRDGGQAPQGAAWPANRSGARCSTSYYARTLATYARAYSWEIGQRERVTPRARWT